jgi:subtilisin family serine protease
MTKSFWALTNFIVLSTLTLIAGCSVETQKGRENFAEGKLPAKLEKLANQTTELRKYEQEILARVDKDAQINTLPIAVIDNGMDLAHPDLISKYDYRVESGKIVGVGYDFMGEDRFPSAALINARLFAFNALEIKNGLIILGPTNVFEDLAKIDDAFGKFFFEKLANDPILNKSLFAKLSRESFNVFDLYKLVVDKKNKAHFDADVYASHKKNGTLFGTDFREKVKANTDMSSWTLYSVYYLLDRPHWNSPGVFKLLSEIEHGDRMFQLIQDSFDQLQMTAQLKTGLDKVVEFQVQRIHSASIDLVKEATSALDFLSTSLNYHRGGITQIDPILSLRDSTAYNLASNLDLFRTKTEYPKLVMDSTSVFESIKASYQKTAQVEQALKNIQKTASENYDIKNFYRNIDHSRKASEQLVRMRAPELVNLFDLNFHSAYTSLYRKHFHRVEHPYLSSMAENESHGTHTSGIVAKQNENLRIYPIRITTRSAVITKMEKESVLSKFRKDFHHFLSQAVVIKAIYSKLPKLVPVDMAEPQNADERRLFADQMIHNLKEAIDVAFEENTLDFIFFKEFEESVIHVAQQNIKIASISLGAELTNRLPKFVDLDPEKDMRLVFQFLNFEFVKFHLGSIITTQGRNTLFVVAAGNSSTWVDGKTHSALPVDLTSRFLKPFENGTDRVAPNNHVTNILGVGSLNEEEDPSDFTNIILGIRTPMIFTVGEDVLSPIKTTDLSPALSLLDKRLPAAYPPISPSDARMLEEFKKSPMFAGIKDSDTFAEKIAIHYNQGLMNLAIVNGVFKRHLAMKFSDHREKYSGTSMATPAVAGILGDLILKKMTILNVGKRDVYQHPEFTPEKLIGLLMEQGEPLFPENPEYPQKKIDVLSKYERGSKVQALERYLNQFLSTAK